MREKTTQSICLEHLTWAPKSGKRVILDDLSVELKSGEIYGILGPNGAGKTSLVRQILNLEQPTEGRVLLDECEIATMSRKALARKIAFMPQSSQNLVDFTAYDMVSLGREIYRKNFSPLQKSDHERIEEAMAWTNCLELREQSILHLSGGERQRVMLARAIAQDSPWLILDEPVSSLDVKQQTEMMNVLVKLHEREHKSIITIVHDLNLARNRCTRLLLLKEGRLCAFGDVDSVLTPENLKRVFDMEFVFVELPGENRTMIVPAL